MSSTSAQTTDLEQDAALGSGASFWRTESSSPHRAIVLTDGPHGVRAQRGSEDHLGIAASEPATCFPPAVGLSQAWDPDLVERVGSALGKEARSLGVGVLLGPGVNIKRDPRAGRNFEYFSEDPWLTGLLGTAWVRGVQGQGVGASLKHFVANEAEHDRMRSDSRVDARTLREIYLRPFERIICDAQPWTIMAAYNKVNGEYVSESRSLLTDILRNEWGFDGVVVSDWGGVRDRVAAVRAGLDLQMPGGNAKTDQAVVDAVRTGALEADAVTRTADRVRALLERVARRKDAVEIVDFDAHHSLAQEAARRSIVLLQNDGILPLAPSGRIAVVGAFAVEPRYQGGGSSHVNATIVDVPLDELRRCAPDAHITFSPAFTVDGSDAEGHAASAVSEAAAADVAVVFLGLGQAQESEGFDREHIDLPSDQLSVLADILAVQPRTVVVLSHGGVVQLPESVLAAPAILDGALLGQGGGRAIADLLLGIASPSGRLTETVPRRLQDTPSYLSFPGEASRVVYGEGVFVGYRWYDARDWDVAFPFGHGLSYTDFRYGAFTAERTDGGIRIVGSVTNVGSRDGREIVQVYVGKTSSRVARAPRELKGFAAVDLAPGETRHVQIDIDDRDLAYWDERVSSWSIEGGAYSVSVGASSRDLRAHATVDVAAEEIVAPLAVTSTMGEALAHPVAGPMLTAMLAQSGGDRGSDAAAELGTDIARMMASIPLDRMGSFGDGAFDEGRLRDFVEAANASLPGTR